MSKGEEREEIAAVFFTKLNKRRPFFHEKEKGRGRLLWPGRSLGGKEGGGRER